jgi:MFS family permease
MEKGDFGLREKTKKLSIKEGVFAGIMDGAGTRYITPYALAVGANNAQIGFLTSVSTLLGTFSQLFTHKAIERFSRRKVIIFGVLLQALMWIPLILVGYLFFYEEINPFISATLVILFYTLITIFGSFISPAWNSLMKDDVEKDRGNYFGNRTRILDFTGLVVMLVCGFLLNYFSKINLFLGFSILFGIAFLSRIISAYLFKKHYDPPLKLQSEHYFSLLQFTKKIPVSNFGKFTLGMALITFGRYIATPFFSVYILKDLQFNYLIWTLIIVAGILGSLVFVPFWGKFADSYGNLKVLKWAGLLIPLVPLLWFLSIFILKFGIALTVVYLFVVEIFSGFILSGFNLCTRNFIYDAVTREKVSLCISYYNIYNGIAIFIGAILGGMIANLEFNFFGITPILFLFLLSTLMRFLFYFVLMPKVREVREVGVYKDGDFIRELREAIFPKPIMHTKHHHVS